MPDAHTLDTTAAASWLRQALESDRSYYVVADVAQLTALAEDCANALDLYGDDDTATIPEWVFELALEVSTQLDLVE